MNKLPRNGLGLDFRWDLHGLNGHPLDRVVVCRNSYWFDVLVSDVLRGVHGTISPKPGHQLCRGVDYGLGLAFHACDAGLEGCKELNETNPPLHGLGLDFRWDHHRRSGNLTDWNELSSSVDSESVCADVCALVPGEVSACTVSELVLGMDHGLVLGSCSISGVPAHQRRASVAFPADLRRAIGTKLNDGARVCPGRHSSGTRSGCAGLDLQLGDECDHPHGGLSRMHDSGASLWAVLQQGYFL